MLRRASVVVPFVALAGGLLAGAAFAANARVEAEARALQKKAIEQDYLNVDYDSAIDKLQTAVTKCGADRCSDGLRAALLRDLGAMQITNNDPDSGNASFVQALKVDGSLDLDPRYKNPQLESAWSAAKKKAGVAAPGLKPAPPVDGLVRTSYPIYAEYTGHDPVAKCATAYKNSAMTDFSQPVELQKHGKGWGTYIPCTDVQEGTLQYYVQCFNAAGQVLAAAGKRDKPFVAAIKPQLPSGVPPALPNDEPPKQCPGDAPMTGPTPPVSTATETGTETGTETEGTTSTPPPPPPSPKDIGEECDNDDQCKSGNCSGRACAPPGPVYPHFWIGAWGGLDALIIGSASNVCKLDQNAGSPSGYFCLDPGNNDFPADAMTNNDIVPATNTNQTQGGFKIPTNTRVGVSFDYAVTPNILIGARLAYVLNTYPGQAAPMQNGGERANKFPPVHLEGRFTYLFGRDAVFKKGVAPYAALAVGLSEFDVGQSVIVQRQSLLGTVPATAWVIGGPFFFGVGGGARLVVANFAVMLGLRFIGAVGNGAGFMPGIEPELGAQIGF